jgi:putative endonuclease
MGERNFIDGAQMKEDTGAGKQNCVYIVRCADGALYSGWTNDIAARIKAHNSGRAAKCTRARLPVQLVYCELCESKSAAMKREYAIKRYTREKKQALIEGAAQHPE